MQARAPPPLRPAAAQMKVGWFLHTPFPSSEIYRMLPLREELLHAVLKADLVGFHTYDYARHFVSACTRILGLEGTPDGVENSGVSTRVAAFPIGIDPDRFTRALQSERVQARRPACPAHRVVAGATQGSCGSGGGGAPGELITRC